MSEIEELSVIIAQEEVKVNRIGKNRLQFIGLTLKLKFDKTLNNGYALTML